MLTNLYNQLKSQGEEDKFDDVLAEMPAVRRDLGYPPLVTPTSQITGSAAALNVLFGRYKMITNEVRDIVRGKYGRVPGEIPKISVSFVSAMNRSSIIARPMTWNRSWTRQRRNWRKRAIPMHRLKMC